MRTLGGDVIAQERSRRPIGRRLRIAAAAGGPTLAMATGLIAMTVLMTATPIAAFGLGDITDAVRDWGASAVCGI